MKNFARFLIVTMVSAVLLVGCGGKKTLESYFDNHADELADIESSSGCDIAVDGNTMTYTFNIGGSYSDEDIATLQDSFDESMASMESIFTSSKDMIEDEADCGEIEMVIKYVDGNNNEVYSRTF